MRDAGPEDGLVQTDTPRRNRVATLVDDHSVLPVWWRLPNDDAVLETRGQPDRRNRLVRRRCDFDEQQDEQRVLGSADQGPVLRPERRCRAGVEAVLQRLVCPGCVVVATVLDAAVGRHDAEDTLPARRLADPASGIDQRQPLAAMIEVLELLARHVGTAVSNEARHLLERPCTGPFGLGETHAEPPP